LFCLIGGIDAAVRAGESPQALRLRALQYSTFGFAMGDIGQHGLARSYFRQAEGCLEREPDPEARSWHGFVYGMYLAGRGRWETCDSVLEEAAAISKASGSLRLWLEALEYRAHTFYVRSRYREALDSLREIAQIALRDGHVQSIAHVHVISALILLLLGHLDDARAEYFDHEAEIHSALGVGARTPHRIAAHAFLTQYAMLTERWDEALTTAEALDRLVEGAQTLSWVLVSAAAASIPLYLTLWEQRGDPVYGRRAAAALDRYQRKYTRTHDIGAAVELTYRCWHAWLAGDEAQARTLGEQAIHAAQTYHMPYFEAHAHQHVARCLPADDPARAEHHAAALRLSAQIGAQCPT
jgi:tetratricopeptide (TPR) repeat protein